ncbi:hypothetical protein DMH17_10385 [Raoultella planticola]|nr:hypothetical protein [Raoultella planticola]
MRSTAVRFASRPPNTRHTFGWLRLTTPAAFVNAIGAGCHHDSDWSGKAIQRFNHPQPARRQVFTMMVIAAAGATGEHTGILDPAPRQWRSNLNVRAAALHVLSTCCLVGRGDHLPLS